MLRAMLDFGCIQDRQGGGLVVGTPLISSLVYNKVHLQKFEWVQVISSTETRDTSRAMRLSNSFAAQTQLRLPEAGSTAAALPPPASYLNAPLVMTTSKDTFSISYT